jgi:hypothetical protein
MKLFKYTIDDWRRAAGKTDKNHSGSEYHKIASEFETYMIYSFSKDDIRWKGILQVAQKKMSDAVDAGDWKTATKAQELVNYQTTLDECRKMLVDAGWTPPPPNEALPN